jgi:hypothetical protein
MFGERHSAYPKTASLHVLLRRFSPVVATTLSKHFDFCSKTAAKLRVPQRRYQPARDYDLASAHARIGEEASPPWRGAAGRNDGILTKNLSFRVHVGGVGVGLRTHNLMASFF